VLRHGDPAADYEVGLYLDAERCRLRVIEVGRGAASAFAQEPPGRAPDGAAEHGRGLLVLRALMDRVGFRLLPGAGSVVSLESGSPTPPRNHPTSRRASRSCGRSARAALWSVTAAGTPPSEGS
jgi:hypothetical protein